MHNYEIEIKVLLGNASAKDIFLSKVQSSFPTLTHTYSESQKNHYFEGGNLLHLFGTFREYISLEEGNSLHTLSKEAKGFSVRTRGTLTQTILVVKATVNDESSSNGTARIEWEVDLAPMNLDDMDAKVLSAGFSYQAKWSREREGYRLGNIVSTPFAKGGRGDLVSEQNPQSFAPLQTAPLQKEFTEILLCLDKNAWYGYLAEFERVITDADKVVETRAELLTIIEALGYRELDQARLARMFDFYNQNWREYYGTENVFTVE